MKTTLLGLALLLFCSCENNLILAESNLEKPLVIKRIEHKNSSESKYYAETGVGYTYYQNDVQFITRRGMFNVGDTLKIYLTK